MQHRAFVLVGTLAAVVILNAGVSREARGVPLPSGGAAEAGAAIRDPHTLANPHQIRVSRVELDLTVDFDRRQLRGTATLDFQRMPGCPPGAPLVLDTRNLTIERAEAAPTAGSWAVTRFEKGPDDPIRGTPLMVSVPGDADRVRISYHTDPDARALEWLTPAQTAGKKKPFLYTQSECIGARTWIPLQDSPSVRITYAATIRVPEGLTAVMGADHLRGGPANAFHFAMSRPIPSYLIALAVGDLAFRPLGPRTGVYAEPSVVDRAAYEFADVETMIAAAEHRFGPYRWGRYDLLVLPPSFPLGGMENPTLTFVTPTLLAGDRSLVDLVAHELAHSWAGNQVTNAIWGDFWINEGFAVYLERRIVEDVYGPERAAMSAVLGLQELRRELETLAPRDQVLRLDLTGRDPDAHSTSVPYLKGALFLTALEEAVGRDRFDAFLRGHFDRFAFQSIATADFEREVPAHLFTADPEARARIDLHAWLDEPGLPTGFPVPTSERFQAVDRQARRWLDGTIRADRIEAAGWSTEEWLHFLRALPADLPASRLAELDAAYHLTDRGNAEILVQWLVVAIRSGYTPADPRVETFLTTVGRRKFVRAIYGELNKTPLGRARARVIYAAVRPFYHPMVVEKVDQLLGFP